MKHFVTFIQSMKRRAMPCSALAFPILRTPPTRLPDTLTSAYKALEAYNDFLRRYPSAPEVGDAPKHVPS